MTPSRLLVLAALGVTVGSFGELDLASLGLAAGFSSFLV